MLRIPLKERPHWQQQAESLGFDFHTLYNQKYWDESAYYQFTLKQIENDLEDPSNELHHMLLELMDIVLNDEEYLRRFAIPQSHWDLVRRSWTRRDPHLYGRFDFSYNGHAPAKLLEANYDTPTSLFESAYFQWMWLEDQVKSGSLPHSADQFNAIQEQLIERFHTLAKFNRGRTLHLAYCKESKEDKGTVEYMLSCAMAAGLKTQLTCVEDIGLNAKHHFIDHLDTPIEWIFKLYPWEFMFTDPYQVELSKNKTAWLEPAWKALLSNKAILPLLWKQFPNHPNLLPAFFEEDKHRLDKKQGIVKKPIFSREGANIDIYQGDTLIAHSQGGYGAEGYIYQAYQPLPDFAGNRTLIGSWMVADQCAGIGIREDKSLITQDLSRFLPHIILG